MDQKMEMSHKVDQLQNTAMPWAQQLGKGSTSNPVGPIAVYFGIHNLGTTEHGAHFLSVAETSSSELIKMASPAMWRKLACSRRDDTHTQRCSVLDLFLPIPGVQPYHTFLQPK